MKRMVLGLATFAALAFAAPAQARVDIDVSIASQRMTVVVDGVTRYVWPVATARSGYVTPRGEYRPTSFQVMHYSRKYHMSPMPHSIFFQGGYAIHGSYDTVGRPASHGCVRLSPQHAAALFGIARTQPTYIRIH